MKDKVIHAAVSFLLTAILALVIKATNSEASNLVCGAFAGIVVMCIGAAKEVYDKFTGGCADPKDLLADAGGCLVAMLFSLMM